ncbi:MAG: hypothetical protein M1833_004376 [Piccolia ochrophora]|nr:MAG: hypothetical protein M1833_004376 [Piccolia ochrophora]
MKFDLFLLTLLGPEFTFTLALGQANAAWKARKAFREAGYPKWGMRHCFFVNMGGVHLQFRDREASREPSFPVDCSQLLYLTSQGHISVPDISDGDIEDRNKSDGLARFITVVQSLWFTAESLGRVTQGLFLTTLELTTLSFVFLMIACSICWWRKPMNILRPMVVRVDVDLSTVLREANAPTRLHGLTPLGFLTRRQWFMTQSWAYFTYVFRTMRLIPARKYKVAEATSFPSIDFLEIDFKWKIPGAILIALYSCMFLATWNFEFPTTIEHTLWRVSGMLAYGVAGDATAGSHHHFSLIQRYSVPVINWISKPFKPRKNMKGQPHQITQHSSTTEKRKEKRWLLDWTRDILPYNDPEMAIPFGWVFLITIPFCDLFFLSSFHLD